MPLLLNGALVSEGVRTATKVVAASDSSAMDKEGADYVCSGANDEVQIKAALAFGGRTICTEGTFECADDIDGLDNMVLLGQGDGITTINFAGGCFFNYNVSDVELGCFNITGYSSHSGSASTAVHFTADANQENYYIHDISATTVGNGSDAVFECYANDCTLSRIRYERCNAIDTDGTGFFIGGTGSVDKVKELTYTDCYAKGCGVPATRPTNWIFGFNITEHPALENVTLTRCHAEGNWCNGFGCETVASKTNIRLVDCTSIDNDQLTGGHPALWQGYGYEISHGTISFVNCKSSGNRLGFLVGGDENDSSSLVVLENCHSISETENGMQISDCEDGRVQIIGGSSITSGAYGLYLITAKHIFIKGLIIDTPVGVSNVGNRLGVSGDLLEDSDIEIYAKGTASAQEVWIDGNNVTLQGSIEATGDYALMFDTGDGNRMQNVCLKGVGGNTATLLTNIDNLVVDGGSIDGGAIGIKGTDGDDVFIHGVRIEATTPIDINDADMVRTVITGCNWYGSTNDPSMAAAVSARVSGNIDKNGAWYGSSGEHLVAEGALAGGAANAYALAWQNPHASKILVDYVVIDVTTAGGTATAVLDVDVVGSATSTDDDILDGIDLDAVAVYDSRNATDAGTNGLQKAIKCDENGGTNDYVTGKILVANASSLVGKYYIHYTVI